jgi:hypothetical protein
MLRQDKLSNALTSAGRLSGVGVGVALCAFVSTNEEMKSDSTKKKKLNSDNTRFRINDSPEI